MQSVWEFLVSSFAFTHDFLIWINVMGNLYPRNAHKVVKMNDEMRLHCKSIQMRLTERLKVFGFTYATQVRPKNIKKTIVLNSLEFFNLITTKRHLVSQCSMKWKWKLDLIDVDVFAFEFGQEGCLLHKHLIIRAIIYSSMG